MIKNKTLTTLQNTFFKPTFQISKYTTEHQKLLTMFKIQQSQITQKEFEQLAELLLKHPIVRATSKFDFGKVNSTLHLFEKNLTQFSKNNYQIKFQFTYMIKSIIY